MKIKSLLLVLILALGSATIANAFWNNWDRGWGGGGPWGGYGHNWNPYDAWDPRYWAEEFEDAFDNDWRGNRYPYYGGYGYPGYGGYGGYGGGYGPYNYPYRNKWDGDLPPNPYYPPRPWY